jgi:RNA polymerase sigma-70 factor (ECF subfamily)
MNDPTIADETLVALVQRMRPALHRYCARMCGSIIEGEDIVQEAVLRAMRARANGVDVDNIEAWLFRIAHNAALDYLRRESRSPLDSLEDVDMLPDPYSPESRFAASATLSLFMQLPIAQRSAVILMDVLGYSLRELSEIIGASLPATKSLLHRGRTSLKGATTEDDNVPGPKLNSADRKRLADYIDKFNARDFDGLREMLSEQVKLDLVARAERSGKTDVGGYFSNYSKVTDWRLAQGSVEGRDVALVFTSEETRPAYFVIIEWSDEKITKIRDFRYARYVMQGAETVTR